MADDGTPIAGTETPEPTQSNLYMGVDQDVPFPGTTTARNNARSTVTDAYLI